MSFRVGDAVMHWTFGLGKVVRLEEREVAEGQKIKYYAVQIEDMTVWVPADEMLETRLRPPTPASEFKKLIKILTGPGEPLPEDRHQRKLVLTEWLKNGRADSLCRAVRSLSSYRQERSLNDNDQALARRLQKALVGEWGFAMSIPAEQAMTELQRILTPAQAKI